MPIAHTQTVASGQTQSKPMTTTTRPAFRAYKYSLIWLLNYSSLYQHLLVHGVRLMPNAFWIDDVDIRCWPLHPRVHSLEHALSVTPTLYCHTGFSNLVNLYRHLYITIRKFIEYGAFTTHTHTWKKNKQFIQVFSKILALTLFMKLSPDRRLMEDRKKNIQQAKETKKAESINLMFIFFSWNHSWRLRHRVIAIFRLKHIKPFECVSSR